MTDETAHTVENLVRTERRGREVRMIRHAAGQSLRRECRVTGEEDWKPGADPTSDEVNGMEEREAALAEAIHDGLLSQGWRVVRRGTENRYVLQPPVGMGSEGRRFADALWTAEHYDLDVPIGMTINAMFPGSQAGTEAAHTTDRGKMDRILAVAWTLTQHDTMRWGSCLATRGGKVVELKLDDHRVPDIDDPSGPF